MRRMLLFFILTLAIIVFILGCSDSGNTSDNDIPGLPTQPADTMYNQNPGYNSQNRVDDGISSGGLMPGTTR